jgi:hypothetical protein
MSEFSNGSELGSWRSAIRRRCYTRKGVYILVWLFLFVMRNGFVEWGIEEVFQEVVRMDAYLRDRSRCRFLGVFCLVGYTFGAL